MLEMLSAIMLQKMYEIGAYFKGSDKEISQGFKLSLTCPFSLIYPIDWIDMFLESLMFVKQESIHQDYLQH